MIFRRFNPVNPELQKETQTNGHNEELECDLLGSSRWAAYLHNLRAVYK